MGCDYDLPPCINDKLDGGERLDDTGIITDFILFIQRDIEINPDEYPLPFQLDLIYPSNAHDLYPHRINRLLWSCQVC
jgi:hypothetical protein